MNRHSQVVLNRPGEKYRITPQDGGTLSSVPVLKLRHQGKTVVQKSEGRAESSKRRNGFGLREENVGRGSVGSQRTLVNTLNTEGRKSVKPGDAGKECAKRAARGCGSTKA